MSKNYSLAAFLLLLAVLTGLSWYSTGALLPPSGDAQIWFHAGLFSLLVGLFVVEYRFTRPNDVFVNCLVVFASTSTLAAPPHMIWWSTLRWGSLLLAVSAMWLAWDPGQESRLVNSRWRAVAYQVITRIGASEVIFSFVFILALLSYFDVDSFETRLFVIAWGVFLLAAKIDLANIGRLSFAKSKFKGRKALGITHSFLAPSIVYCRKLGTQQIGLHQLVGFCQSAGKDSHCFGVVIGERSSATENRVVVALLNKSVSESGLNDRSLMVTTTEHDVEAVNEIANHAEQESLKGIVGTIAKGTNISRIIFEMFGNPAVAAGSLLSVRSAESDVFYQVFDGSIDEELSIKDSTRAFVEGEAEQVGVWDQERGGFDTHDWVAKERSQVRLIDQNTPAPEYQLKDLEHTVGAIPQSNYPVNVDLGDLVLYHSAILGVTGSGKSYLTFSLVEKSAAKGIKTVCIDPTGDYQRYLHDAVLLAGEAQIKAFLNSTEHMIGIVETASRPNIHPIDHANRVSLICLNWCRQNRTDEDILSPQPKVLVVLEEAHLLVPEWNFAPQNMRDTVSAHSQIVLQARKYGLGFLVVSQRTANVTKSILNQCNTIVSFQAFDETGFEFLKNYLGNYYVKALPNLKTRHGIIVGKASRSRRPLMVKFTDQERQLRNEPAVEMPLPPAAELMNEGAA